jgi:[glutamine synthetase] adenylyltransferase / [glutamine synthetase]-adenylyl-L-tyrosine phosphorylase
MALTRARVLTGQPSLRAKLETAIADVLERRRERSVLAADVRDMRQRIADEKGSGGKWDLKLARGGMVDVEFITQYLQLLHAHDHRGILDQNSVVALEKLTMAGLLSPNASATLIPAARLYQSISQTARLCLDGPFDPSRAPKGLEQLLARAGDAPDMSRLEAGLEAAQGEVSALFAALVA